MTQYKDMTNQELNNLRYQLAQICDDEMGSVYGGYNDNYDEGDLARWDESIRSIDEILRTRPITNPYVRFTLGGAGDDAHPYKPYWRCEIGDEAWPVRFAYLYHETEQDARAAFAGWCAEHHIDPASMPETVTVLR